MDELLGLKFKEITLEEVTKDYPDVSNCRKQMEEHLKSHIREVPFKGVNFYDVTPLLSIDDLFNYCVEAMSCLINLDTVDLVIGPESRGFILGGAVANYCGAGFLPVRKRGALPVVGGSIAYQLEYGAAVLEIPEIDWTNIENIVVIDDLLATGGTAAAVNKLLKTVGKSISKYVFLIELTALNGRDKLDAPVESLLQY